MFFLYSRFLFSIFCFFTIFALSGCATSQQRQINVPVSYYDISGNSTREWDREIQKKGPLLANGRRAVAVTRVRIITSSTFKLDTNTCFLSNANALLDAEIILPQWTGYTTAPKKLKETWNKIINFARDHEARHVDIALEFTNKMRRQLNKIGPQKTCGELQQKTNQTIQKIKRQHIEKQNGFDEDERKHLSRVTPSIS